MVRFARHGVFVFVPARPGAAALFRARRQNSRFEKNIFGKREFQMKKWMAGALALAMVLAMALTGCGGSASSGAVSGSAAASGADDNVLMVAMECAYAPYNWTQNDDSNGAVPISGSSDYANGYDVMMAKKNGRGPWDGAGNCAFRLGFAGSGRDIRHGRLRNCRPVHHL